MELAQPKNWLDKVAIWCATYLIFVIVALSLLLPRYTGPLLIVLPILMAWLVAFLLQLVFRRNRPFQNGEKPFIKMMFETPSFPSAHTAIATSVACVYLIDDEPFWILFMSLAVIMAWSRVRVRVHYVSDTIAGAVVGIAGTYLGVAFLSRFL